MKKEYALFNLTEAKQHIEQLIETMKSDPEYDDGNYIVDMQNIYWHINRAWNGRNFDMTSSDLTDEVDDANIQFPTDLVL